MGCWPGSFEIEDRNRMSLTLSKCFQVWDESWKLKAIVWFGRKKWFVSSCLLMNVAQTLIDCCTAVDQLLHGCWSTVAWPHIDCCTAVDRLLHCYWWWLLIDYRMAVGQLLHNYWSAVAWLFIVCSMAVYRLLHGCLSTAVWLLADCSRPSHGTGTLATHGIFMPLHCGRFVWHAIGFSKFSIFLRLVD